MTDTDFKKIIGKKFEYASDGVFEFPAVVVNAMQNVHLWYDMYFAAKLTKGDIDFYLHYHKSF
jgi:hypothetical protein